MCRAPSFIACGGLLMALLSGCANSPPIEPVHSVTVESGNIVGITESGSRIALTNSSHDIAPVLAPNGRVVVFVRESRLPNEPSGCPVGIDQSPPYAHDELWAVNADGSDERPLVQHDPIEDPDWDLCIFRDAQFSSDSRLVYFLAPAAATASGLHVYDLVTKRRKLVTYGGRFFVLDHCARAEYVDYLVIAQHDYFLLGGSYDWWWLVAPDGKRVGPLGYDTREIEYECKIKLPLEQ